MNSSNTNNRKGKMVEALAARLLRAEGVNLSVRAMVPPASGLGRPREIDILATVTMPTGQQIHFAVECKNESAPIEAQYIDAFYGKLIHIGVPAENGIFVSRSRYRKGAVDRAKEAGIRILNIKGLRDDGLTDMIFKSLQSIIWLLADVDEFTLVTDSVTGSHLFCDTGGNYVGMVTDIAHRAWVNQEIPQSIGTHRVKLSAPSHWYAYTPSGPANIMSMEATVTVCGVAYVVHGKSTSHALVHADSNRISKIEIQANWDEERDDVTIKVLPNTQALESHIRETEAILHLIVKDQPLPRINTYSEYGRMYWPPSTLVWNTIMQRYSEGKPLGHPDDDFEGTEFSRIFDEPSANYNVKWHEDEP